MPESSNTRATKRGESGVSGLKYYNGIIHDERLPALTGRREYATYEEMARNDATVAAILFGISMLIRSVEWQVRAATESPQDEDAREFVESCLHDMSQSWSITLSDVVSMFKFGWSFHEIVYKRRLGPRKTDSSKHNDGRLGWKRLPIRAQASLDRWVFDDHGIVQGMVQRAAPNYNAVFIPIERSLLFRTESSLNNPEGRSILRPAFRPWFYKKNIRK